MTHPIAYLGMALIVLAVIAYYELRLSRLEHERDELLDQLDLSAETNGLLCEENARLRHPSNIAQHINRIIRETDLGGAR